MSERTRTKLHNPVVPPDAQNDDPASVAAHAAAGAAHAAVSSAQTPAASPGALPVESQYPLFPNLYIKGGAIPAKLAVYKDAQGEIAYQGTISDIGATEDKIRGMFGSGTYRLELRDEQNRVLKGGQRHGVRIDPDPRERPREEKSTAIVQVHDQVSLERKLSEERLRILRDEQEHSIARRKLEVELELKRAREEADAKEKAADAKLQRELQLQEARAKAEIERERLRYENERARDQAQMQMFLSMQTKSTEVVIQALAAQKTDAGLMVGMLKDGLAMGMQNAQGNPEMAQMALMGKGMDAIAGALGSGSGGGAQQQVKQLEDGAKKELAGAGVEPTKAQRMIAKMKTVIGKAVSHGIDPEQALDKYIQDIEAWEAAGGDEGDDEGDEPAPPKAKGKTDARDESGGRPADAARSETRAVAKRAAGDGNGAGAKRAGTGNRPRRT